MLTTSSGRLTTRTMRARWRHSRARQWVRDRVPPESKVSLYYDSQIAARTAPGKHQMSQHRPLIELLYDPITSIHKSHRISICMGEGSHWHCGQ